MHKAEQDRRLIQFLMGLNEVYTTVRGSILMMNPLPSMAHAFSLLIQEEKQREVKPHNQLMLDSASLNVNVPSYNNFNNRAPMNNNFRTNYSPNNHPSTSARLRHFCDHCKRIGHTKDKCFKLHGYPQDFNQNPKYNKGKRTTANVHTTPIDTFCMKGEETQTQGSNSNVSLTREQYDRLVTLLQHFQTSTGGDNSDNNVTGGAVNFAGIFACSAFVLSVDFGLLSCPFNEEASGDCLHCQHPESSVDVPIFHSQLVVNNSINLSSIPIQFSTKQPFLCSICPMARQPRLAFPHKTSTITSIFELLHVDLWGPYHIATRDNYKYFFTLWMIIAGPLGPTS
ncbi:PREDICTED: uncharacterized protein LOC109243798 [Nicotiana attenuata]|uniref:uncharacterized protein LOC109243798 n=1 Tax=Nicotiana attenuata TaxID=49451 RepID=UPI000904E470|nr:PREDICTED: uncharacterized protein LOC109243798 [Nicotiana attenuata]